jgi:hypothetical protein
MLRSIGPMELIVVVLTIGIAALMAIPFCRISRRLGYSSAWGLITILPLGALACPAMLHSRSGQSNHLPTKALLPDFGRACAGESIDYIA